MKCKRPMKHRPQMEGVRNCKQCACEAKSAEVIRDLTGEEE